MFLEAHMEEGSAGQPQAEGTKGATASATQDAAIAPKVSTPEKAVALVEAKPLPTPQEAAPLAVATGVPDVKSIAGSWAGRIEYGPRSKTATGDVPVTMTVKEDGTYDAVSPGRSKGNMRVAGGKYVLTLGGETFRLALEQRAGKRILKGSNYDGSVVCELTQEK
jgi:hypothetical protein